MQNAPPPSPSKKRAEVPSEDAPTFTKHLKMQGKHLPFIEAKTITAMNKQAEAEKIPIPFPSELIKNLENGTICYVIYEGTDDKGKSHKYLERGYLVQLVHKGENTARVHVADVSYISGLKKDKEYYDDVKLEERVYVLETPKKRRSRRKKNKRTERRERRTIPRRPGPGANQRHQGTPQGSKKHARRTKETH